MTNDLKPDVAGGLSAADDRPKTPPLSVPVPPAHAPEVPTEPDRGVPPLSVPVAPEAGERPSEPKPGESPLSVPVAPDGD